MPLDLSFERPPPLFAVHTATSSPGDEPRVPVEAPAPEHYVADLMSEPTDVTFSRATSDRVAAAWERYRDRIFRGQQQLSEWMVDSVDPKPGQTVLELAAGPGETGFLAAARLEPGGRLISTDVSDAMVAAARRGAEAAGLTNVEFRTMDAQAIDLRDASVDGILCRFGLMFVPERARAFAEMRRVLRRGGRLAYGVWGPPDRNPWLTHLVLAIVQHGHQLPGDPFAAGGPFSLAAPDDNRAMLDAAGFNSVELVEIDGAQRYDSVDEYWDVQTAISGPVAVLVDGLPAEECAAIKETLASMVEPFRTDAGGYELPTFALGVAAS